MQTLFRLASEDVLSGVLIFTGVAVLLLSVAQLLRALAASAARAGRSWALAARHMRRASAARDAARRSRERLLREDCGYREILRRDPNDGVERSPR